jgi:hypothetical protein
MLYVCTDTWPLPASSTGAGNSSSGGGGVSGAGSSRDSVKKATSPEAELEVSVLRALTVLRCMQHWYTALTKSYQMDCTAFTRHGDFLFHCRELN